VNRDDEIEKGPSRPPANDEVDSETPIAPDSHDNVRRPELPDRPRTGMGAWQPPTAPLSPLRVPSGSLNRNVPSHPAWEKPPSPYNYPRIRGQEKPKSMAPLIIAAVAVVLILGAVVAFPAFLGRGKTAPAATATSSASAGVSNQPLQSATPSQPVDSSGGTPAPVASFQQYKVQTGDSVAKIAVKFHLQRWELLLANPQLTAPAYAVRLNTYLNIPLPGQLTQPPATPTDSPTASLGATLVAP
jgi:LysM repeat protein